MAQIAVCENNFVIEQDGSLTCDSWIVQDYDPSMLQPFFETTEDLGDFLTAIFYLSSLIIGYLLVRKVFWK